MKIAYYSHYVGKEFARRAGMGNKNGGSPSLKTQGMARALLKAGHEVTIYSPAITECNCKVNGFRKVICTSSIQRYFHTGGATRSII